MPSPKPGIASLKIKWFAGSEEIPVQFNPTELQFEKQAQYAEINIPGLAAPLQQFVRGAAEILTVELFFDTSDHGTGVSAKPVTELTDQIFAATLIEPKGHTPPPVVFKWGDGFPGHSLPAKQANQSRTQFKGIITNCRQTFTFWSRGGIPLRAKMSLTIREFQPLNEQLFRLNLSSPDRTHGHVLRGGESLAGLAHEFYRRPDEWRRIATDNDIEDPRRLTPGLRMRIPSIPTSGDQS
jgi:nucleoid-associated protein YgaU